MRVSVGEWHRTSDRPLWPSILGGCNMDFKGPYLFAMRQRAPKIFLELCRSGQLDQHLQDKSNEAHALLEQLLANEPKGVDSLPKDPQALRLAEERVLGELLDFPTPDYGETFDEDFRAPRSTKSYLRLVKR